jgi:hypothetical protein
MSRLRQATCRAQEFFSEKLAEFTYQCTLAASSISSASMRAFSNFALVPWNLFDIGLILLGPIKPRLVDHLSSTYLFGRFRQCEPLMVSSRPISAPSSLIWNCCELFGSSSPILFLYDPLQRARHLHGQSRFSSASK